MEYSELEKKVIEKGRKSFIKELQDASKPMLVVLRKYGVLNKHELLEEIKVIYPYSTDACWQYAIQIERNKLDSLDSIILDHFMEEIAELKERINDIDV